MKTKTLTKKLVLSRSTIANLQNSDMKEAYGGASLPTRCMSECVLCPTERPFPSICISCSELP